MISQITIKNFGLIDDLTVELSPGLNAFTGETGAGKSIIMDAIRFALGERFSSSQAHDPSKNCVVELLVELKGEFSAGSPLFKEHLAAGENTVIINRTVYPDAKNRIKVNGFNLTVSQLKDLGDHLVDFHGPNDHQMLLEASSHIMMLDRLCGMEKEKKDYSDCYGRYASLLREENELNGMAMTRTRDIDFLSHQINELRSVPLDAARYDEVRSEEARVNNSEKLFDSVNSALAMFENSEAGIADNIGRAFEDVEKIASLDPGASPLLEKMTSLQETAEEMLEALKNYAGSLSFDPDSAEEIKRFSDAYYEIHRKYGSIEAAARFYGEAVARYETLANFEEKDAELKENIKKTRSAILAKAAKLTKERVKTGAGLKHVIEKELQELGMKHVKFECHIEKADPGPDGCDNVVFYLSPNAGESVKPLSDIVSSGEAARIMLALKKALIEVDPMPVLIFDEIDAQIGGRIGSVIGKKLKELASLRQVIFITHLPQTASYADAHYKVIKNVEKNKTLVRVAQLAGEERVKEISEMMSGSGESDISLKHARDMLKDAIRR